MSSKLDKIVLTRAQDRRTKLSDEQIEEIRNLYSSGFTQKAIAGQFEVCQSTVAYIVSDKCRETLRNYRLNNPPKRRTREEAKLYMRDLRAYKRELLKTTRGEQ